MVDVFINEILVFRNKKSISILIDSLGYYLAVGGWKYAQ